MERRTPVTKRMRNTIPAFASGPQHDRFDRSRHATSRREVSNTRTMNDVSNTVQKLTPLSCLSRTG